MAQIEENVLAYARHLPLKIAKIYGGVGEKPQKDALRAELKSLWLADQKKRMTELGRKAQAAKKSSPSHDMARAYGEEQMLEMAQMAEVPLFALEHASAP